MVDKHERNDVGGGKDTKHRPAGNTGATEKGAGPDHPIPQADGDDGSSDDPGEEENAPGEKV